TLTVAVVVLVFRRLPAAFPRTGRTRRRGALPIALAVGGMATAATYLATGRRGLSDVGARFLAEGEGLTGGSNVVNTILVDFRALDTLGEVVVLAVAAIGLLAMVRLVTDHPVPAPRHEAADDP